MHLVPADRHGYHRLGSPMMVSARAASASVTISRLEGKMDRGSKVVDEAMPKPLRYFSSSVENQGWLEADESIVPEIMFLA